MISCSRTTVEGRYIFSGDNDTAPAYQADATSPTGATQLIAASATRLTQDPGGGAFLTGKTAQEIFDSRNPADGSPAADNVFAALNSLKNALLSGDPTAVLQTTGAIQSASDHLNLSQSFYGAVQSRISDAQSFADRYDIELQTQLSQKQDADVISAALTLTQSNTQLQAAMQMKASVPHRSLFDFLG
jgi:flagellin-like hook-associated protein FlgL